MAKPLAEIESPKNLRLHRVGWAAQKIFRVVLLLFVAAAALGAFGTGWLSQQEQRIGTWLLVRSERYARTGDETRLEFTFLDGKPQPVALVLPLGLTDHYEIEKVWPEPIRQTSSSQGLEYEFEHTIGGQAVLILKPMKAGRFATGIRLGQEQVPFSQFVYP